MKSQNHFTPLRQNLYDQFTLCKYSVPTSVTAEIVSPKFFQMKREASRTAYYIQAISRVLKKHPRVNSSFVRNFWTNSSRLVQWDTVDAAVSVDRKFGNERYPFFYVIRNSDKLKVKEIDELIRHVTEAPVESIPEFKNFLRFLEMPSLIRRILLHRMICNEELLKSRIGTFSFTNLSFWGFKSATLPTPRLLVGVSTPDPEKCSFPMGYSFNHVITDGAQIGEFHRDMQRFFRKCEFE